MSEQIMLGKKSSDFLAKQGFVLFLLVLLFASCKSNLSSINLESEDLQVMKLTDHVYQHISYLETTQFGKVACNGVIYAKNGEAIVFDSPATNEASVKLIDWIQRELKSELIAVVPTHFHEDCLGGLEVFHDELVPSMAFHETIELAKLQNYILPQKALDLPIEMKVGNEKVIMSYFGKGHTVDNIVAFIPDERVLFGGCLIKRVGAGKGNLEDADINEWSNTVEKIKLEYPQVKVVVPGHGNPGGMELLDYTIELFKKD